jgi:hypothetical protein
MEYFECNYCQKKVEQMFKGAVLIEKMQRSGNSQWILNYQIDEIFKLYLSSDRGIMDIYITKKDKPLGIKLMYSQIRNLDTNKKNIDFLFEFLTQHKDDIFIED